MAEFRRVLGPFDATCVVIGAIVGVGIFFTPSTVARIAGSGELAMIAWAVAGVIALCGAFAFAELGGLYPRTAGQYEILRDLYGDLAAFLFVVCNATIIIPGAAALIAIICAQNLGVVIHGTLPAAPSVIVPAAVLIAGLSAANAIGVRWGASIQNVTVIAKIIAIVAVIAIAATGGAADVTGPVTTAEEAPQGFGIVGAVFAALVACFFSYGGWQQALWVGGEVRHPERNVPRAIMLGVAIVVLVYLLVNWAYLRLLGPAGVAGSGALAADAVAAGWPGAGSRVVAGAVAASAFGVLNVQFLTGPRLIQGLAADGQLPAVFRGVSEQRGTPIPAIGLLAGMALLILFGAAALSDSPDGVVDSLTTGVVFVDCIFFALTGLAVMLLRKRRPDAARPVRVPLYPIVPIIFVAGECAILVGAYLDARTRAAAVIGMGWIIFLTVLWFLTRRGKPGQASGPEI